MAASERRTLEIIAKIVDQVSRPLAGVTRALARFAADGAQRVLGLVKSMVSLRSAVSGLLIGFAALKTGGAFAGIIEANAELAKIARGTGVAAERLITLKDALGLAGIEGTRFRGLLASLTKAVGTALNDGGSKAAEAMGKLGLTLEDLRSTDPVTLFDKLAGSLERFASPQEKAAAILEVFPKAAENVDLLVDALGRGQKEFRNLVATAQFFGGSLSSEGIASITRMAGAMDLLQLSIEGVGRTATVRLAQQLAPSIERIATFIAQNREALGDGIAKVATVIGRAVVAVTAAVLRLVAFLSANGSKVIESLEQIPLVGERVASALRAIFDVQNIEPGARGIRDTMEGVAREVVQFEAEIEEVRKRLANPVDVSLTDQMIDQKKLADLQQLRASALQALHDLDLEFADKTGARLDSQEQAALDSARVQKFAGTLSNLFSFDQLPAPPTDLAPIIKALFGADGVDGAERKVRSFADGVNDGVSRVVEQWKDFGRAGADAAQRIVGDGLDGVTNALTDVVTGAASASEAFRKLAQQMIREIVNITIRLLIMQAIMAATGLGVAPAGAAPIPAAEDGGVLPGTVRGTVPVRRFESGGVVRQPTLALFGEGRASRGEAFVPLPDGRRIPVHMTGGGGGGNVVHITIQAMDGADVTRVLVDQRETLRALWNDDVSKLSSVRQSIAGASR